MKHQCYFCHLKTVEKLIDKFDPPQKFADEFVNAIGELLNEEKKLANPYLATLIHRLARKFINNGNLYQEEKIKSNNTLLNNSSIWKKLIHNSKYPLYTATKLAVAGNIIDYGAHSSPENIEDEIHKILDTDFAIDYTDELFKQINKAKSILYLGDNAGEIVFDKLFIETMQHKNVTYAVRGRPVINDVTFDDAQQVKMHQVATVISNGYDAPSTLIEHCSDEFQEAYLKAELVISKGQGNFEGLMDSRHNNLFFLLMAKCSPMAELLGVKKGNIVVNQLNAN
jgi:uncharacterized protein with ATP-grasp and redox domains